jgi:regulator of protease activity HflC (stomatin/prohibitin superfamily)
VRDRLIAHHIDVDAVSITDFNFSEEYNRAIEAKVTAQQNALKAENDLTRIKIEAEQKWPSPRQKRKRWKSKNSRSRPSRRS